MDETNKAEQPKSNEEESNQKANEPQEGASPATKKEAAPKKISLKDIEEDPDMSEAASLLEETQESNQEFTKSKKSLGQLTLRSGKSLPTHPPDETLDKGQSVQSVISRGRGKGRDTACSSIQTSLIWEFKPLAEILQTKNPPHQLSEIPEKDAIKSEDRVPVGNAETEQQIVHEYYVSSQTLREEPPGDSQPVKEVESRFNMPEPKSQKQPPEGQVAAQDGYQQLKGLPEDQNKNPTHNEDNTVWIHPKTGKEMKCSFNQTNPVWERKPLAEILRASGLKGENASLGGGNGGASPISQRIHVPYNPDDPEWAGYPNPFEY